MNKTQEQLDEELMMSLLPTIDDMFTRMFTRSVCEAEVSDLPDEEDDDEISGK